MTLAIIQIIHANVYMVLNNSDYPSMLLVDSKHQSMLNY